MQIESASKRYDGATALNEVSLVFPDDAVTAVIGPSGCGKSTLLKLCNGLIKPDSGSVHVLGEPIDYQKLPALRRRLGYAVQGTGLFPHLTAGENITLLAKLAGWSQANMDARCAELSALARLEQAQLARYPHQLSGGQQQRVGLCRAMMLKPEILLLDEPFAAIDPITREDIHQQLLTLQQAEPVTTVLVTHDMREALLLADHIVVMQAGLIVLNESREQLLARNPQAEPQALLRSLLVEAGK